MASIGRLVAFLASTDLDRSAAFYSDTVGLPVRERNSFALVLDGGGTELRVTLVGEKSPAPYTVLGWQVAHLDTAVDELRGRDVRFLRYEGMSQDDHDAWTTPDGGRVAWFSDPDGNVLSLHEHA